MPLILLILAGCRPDAATAPAPMTLSAEQRAAQLASFDRVWSAVKENHYDPKMNGVDWDAVRVELRPKVEAAASEEEVRNILMAMLERLKLSHYAIAESGGEAGSSEAAVEYRSFVPPLARNSPEKIVQFGNVPPVPLRYHYERLPENVGYFYFSIFLNPPTVMPAFNTALDDARSADGFILDLRHNPGGIGIMAVGIGNAFVDKADQKLGTMIQRSGELNFVLNPQAEPYTKPLAILIDAHSGSTSEILAGGLKDLGRARVFGIRSAGQALPSLIETLPNGDRFQFAVANYISTGGQTLEGNGVTPDEIVPYELPYDLPDPVVAAAVKWIQSQTSNKSTP
ncbi:MAG TPA: S41 family peptidase [Tepidisphaeraceae bacterium]